MNRNIKINETWKCYTQRISNGMLFHWERGKEKWKFVKEKKD